MVIQVTQLYWILETLAAHSNIDRRQKFLTQISRSTNFFPLYFAGYWGMAVMREKQDTQRSIFPMARLDSALFGWFFCACLMWSKHLENKTTQENNLAQKHNMWGGKGTLVSNKANISENFIFHTQHFLLWYFKLFFFPQNKPDQKKKKNPPKTQNLLKRSEGRIFHILGCGVIAFLFSYTRTTWESLQIPFKIAGNELLYTGPHCLI